ncbi:hypothetical protein D1007_09296 [Hordeum vulgare]|nr:hypothetical protein D1007_09296 [Hordeum vulgare]
MVSLGVVFGGYRMSQPDKYLGLDEYYEQKHRAVLVERGEVPPLLRLRGHNPNETLLYDPRYEPYFRTMDLLQFVLNFKGTPPWLNATALTALTDRWRPETHSFHLPLGEMSITLEDIAMITGLPIEGRARTGKLDGACMRSKTTSSLGGSVWALKVWMWERIPVGRNFSLAPEEPWKYPFDGDEERYPTIAYTWANVQWKSIVAMGRYKAYISELDMLTYEQVNWRPYTVLRQFPLSNMCLRDQHLWRVRCPMICFYAVEWHLPHRVSKQFGVHQCTPPDYVETSVKLHKTNRQSNKIVINWEEDQMTWVDMWNA